MSISVVIPSIPTRHREREAVLRQIKVQTLPPDEVIVWVDDVGAGAAITRNLGLAEATSDFVAFFDDDDEMYPRHLELLERTQATSGADLVYPWHDLKPSARNPLMAVGEDPFGRPFDKAAARQIRDYRDNFIPVAVLVRRELMARIGGFADFKLDKWDPAKCEVLDAWQKLLSAGATFAHCPHKTWAAVRNGQNTAGLNWHRHTGTKQRGYDKGARR